MHGMGTVINTISIILGGVLGLLFGKALTERFRDTLGKACGVAVLFIGLAGALEGMLTVTDEGKILSGGGLLIIGCLVIGSLTGELLNIEGLFERFGEWLKRKTGSSKDTRFVDGFVTASFTVCIGAMAIVGSIEDGISGDFSVLLTKSILDFIIIMVMAGAMGKGCVFSAIPVAVLQGTVTALSVFIKPLLTDASLSNLSTVGSVLIFCVGVNLVWGKKVKVANMLPAVLFAVVAAYIQALFA